MCFTTTHPDGLFCPVCGCSSIHWWPELVDWDKWDDKKKKNYEVCPACGYGERKNKNDNTISLTKRKIYE